jgi:hypothetical protein
MKSFLNRKDFQDKYLHLATNMIAVLLKNGIVSEEDMAQAYEEAKSYYTPANTERWLKIMEGLAH